MIKKNLAMAGLVGGIAITSVAGMYQQANACGVGVSEFKATANLNIRAGAGTEYPVVGTLKKGQVVKPIASHKDGLWGEIKLSNGKTGCVSMKYLEEIDTCDTDSNSNTLENCTGYLTANLNVRRSPSTSGSIATTLPKGTQVKVIYQTSTGWSRIEYKNGEIGYVSSKYVSKSNVTTTESNTTTTTVGKSGVTTARLNLRSDSNTSSSVILVLEKGATVDVISKTSNGWYYVECKNPNSGKPARGYVSAKYVSITNNTVVENNTVVTAGKSGVTTARLNLRSNNNTSSSVILVLEKGATVDVISKTSNGWYYVECKNPNSGKPAKGYVSAKYVSVTR